MGLSVIGLEEHFVSRAIVQSGALPPAMFLEPSVDRLSDLSKTVLLPEHHPCAIIANGQAHKGEGRLRDMDEGSMEVQVVSHVPLLTSTKDCHKTKDQLSAAVAASGRRLRGFACLPMGAPQDIASELERCVTLLGIVGALIPNHAEGHYFDAAEFWAMFRKAQDLDVPLYVHPTTAEDVAMASHAGNYSDMAQFCIAGPAFGWHADVAIHVLRLFSCGLFDDYSRLKLIVGHDGECLPSMVGRVQRKLARHVSWQRDFRTVWHENIRITMSGMFNIATFQQCLHACKPDRILHSVGYPFDDPTEGLDFMKEVQKSGILSEEHFNMFCQGNARKP